MSQVLCFIYLHGRVTEFWFWWLASVLFGWRLTTWGFPLSTQSTRGLLSATRTATCILTSAPCCLLPICRLIRWWTVLWRYLCRCWLLDGAIGITLDLLLNISQREHWLLLRIPWSNYFLSRLREVLGVQEGSDCGWGLTPWLLICWWIMSWRSRL